MNRYLIYIIGLLSMIVVACDDYDEFTASPDARLEFSSDSVNFDTYIATVGSSTRTMYVFNRNSKGVRISSIYLQNGELSHFRANVDGQFLANGKGDDFEIRKKDSLVVRLEVKLPETGTNAPVYYTDRLCFRMESGETQYVDLTAYGQDAYILHGLNVDTDLTLLTDKPYVIYDSLVVQQGATLTLVPGTTLMFHDKCGLTVRGRVDAQGTLEEPVTLRGDRTDHMFDYLLYDNTPSRWEGIHIESGSFGNRFVNCDIHSACYGIVCDSTSILQPCVEIENSVIHNIGGDALSLQDCYATVANSQISNAHGHCVRLLGGKTSFTHCTIAQYYLFHADRGDALNIANLDLAGEYHPIESAQFINTVITGYGDDVIMGNINEDYEDCRYLFHHSYLTTVESDDFERFYNVAYDNDDQEYHSQDNFTLFDSYNFIYDFTPLPESGIVSLADPRYAEKYPFDRLGRKRDAMPDAGCYEYVPTEEKEEEE